MVPPVLVIYFFIMCLFIFILTYLVYFAILLGFPRVSACITADSYNVTTTGRIKEAFSEKNKPPDTRNESWVSKLCVSCPAMGERHRGNARCIYSSDLHTSPQPSSSYEDTYVSFMEPFSEWNCCNVIDAPTIKRRSPDTVQTSLSSSDTFIFPL